MPPVGGPMPRVPPLPVIGLSKAVNSSELIWDVMPQQAVDAVEVTRPTSTRLSARSKSSNNKITSPRPEPQQMPGGSPKASPLARQWARGGVEPPLREPKAPPRDNRSISFTRGEFTAGGRLSSQSPRGSKSPRGSPRTGIMGSPRAERLSSPRAGIVKPSMRSRVHMDSPRRATSMTEEIPRTAVSLKLDQAPPDKDDSALYLPVLRELVGEEIQTIIQQELTGPGMRELLREELAHAGAARGAGSEGLSEMDEEDVPPSSQILSDMAAIRMREVLDVRLDVPPAGAQPEEELRPISEIQPDTHPPLGVMQDAAQSRMRLAVTERRGKRIVADHEGLDTNQLFYSQYSPMMRKYMEPMDRWWQSLGKADGPITNPYLHKFIAGNCWGALSNAITLGNCLCMLIAVDHQLKYPSSTENDQTFFYLSCFFFCFYCIEFGLKITDQGWHYFTNRNFRLNILDFVLLLGNAASVALSLLSKVTDSRVLGFSWIRAVRIVKLLKVLRILKFASYFKTLRAIMQCLSETFLSTFWSLTMLVLIFFMFSLAICSRITQRDDTSGMAPVESHPELLKSFGSVFITVESLIMASTGGADWGEYYRLLELPQTGDHWLFLIFILFVEIAMLNVILGIFVDTAMKALEPNSIEKAHNRFLEELKLEDLLQELCDKADKDHDGTMTIAEWKAAVRTPPMGEYLYMLGLPPHHMTALIHMLAGGARSEAGVKIEDFVAACMQLRGSATSFDMNAVLYELLETKELVMRKLHHKKSQ